MSLLRAAKRNLLRPVVKQAAGVLVRYNSGVSGMSYDVVATMANSAAEAELDNGIQFTEQIKDFKIDVADLPVAPSAMDTIDVLKDNEGDEQLGVAEQRYQVLSDGAARAFEPNDHHEDTWLIHTKNIPGEPETVPAFGNANGDAFGNAAGDIYGGPSD